MSDCPPGCRVNFKSELFNITDQIDLILILLMKYIFIYGYFLKSFTDQNFAYNLSFIRQYLSRPRRRKASVKGIQIKEVKT